MHLKHSTWLFIIICLLGKLKECAGTLEKAIHSGSRGRNIPSLRLVQIQTKMTH